MLATDPSQRAASAATIIDAEVKAVVLAEICQIAVQMLLAAVPIHAAFGNREVAFDGVRVGIAANVLAEAVAHAFVAHEHLARGVVERGFVGDRRVWRARLAGW